MYFDPWLAGVVLPSLIIVGLMAIPYVDTNPKGNGYYTFNERKAEITIFLVRVCRSLVVADRARHVLARSELELLWAVRVLGYPQARSRSPMSSLSEYICVRGLGRSLPDNWLIREFFGLALTLVYIGVLPVMLAKTVFREYYEKLGAGRFYVTVFLFLMMLALPIKMLTRWLFNLKYVVSIPEFFFNI